MNTMIISEYNSIFKPIVLVNIHLSRHMGKPTICIGENKDADQLRRNCEADHTFVFATRIVQFLFFLNPKFLAFSLLLYVTVQTDLCQTCLESTLSVFPCRG